MWSPGEKQRQHHGPDWLNKPNILCLRTDREVLLKPRKGKRQRHAFSQDHIRSISSFSTPRVSLCKGKSSAEQTEALFCRYRAGGQTWVTAPRAEVSPLRYCVGGQKEKNNRKRPRTSDVMFSSSGQKVREASQPARFCLLLFYRLVLMKHQTDTKIEENILRRQVDVTCLFPLHHSGHEHISTMVNSPH